MTQNPNTTLPPLTRLGSFISLSFISLSLVALNGCQTLHPVANGAEGTDVVATVATPARLQQFNIRGKIGVVVPQPSAATPTDATAPAQSAQSGSAFYVWAQDGDRFAIDLTGALGIGHTVVEYNGQSATLVSERTGTLTATDPDVLLQQATGWHAPISQLPYWISGKPAPSDTDNEVDAEGRLQTAHNSDWTASFGYPSRQSTLPDKIKAQHRNGYKVVMTIAHVQ